MIQGLNNLGWLLICIYMIKYATVPEVDCWESGLRKMKICSATGEEAV